MKMRHILASFLMMLTFIPAFACAFDLVRSNCNLKNLELSSTQKESLQQLRHQLKNDVEKVRLAQQHRMPAQLAQTLLSQKDFDCQIADKIAQERYQDDIAQTVLELKFYYQLFQILNAQQQQMWLEQCLSKP